VGLLASTVPASTAIQQATSGSNLHFYVTSGAIGLGVAIIGFFLKRLIDQNDERAAAFTQGLHETNGKLDDTNHELGQLAQALASLAGEIKGAEKANVKERRRVRARERGKAARSRS
jgi:uncharacterized protein HemX